MFLARSKRLRKLRICHISFLTEKTFFVAGIRTRHPKAQRFESLTTWVARAIHHILLNNFPIVVIKN